MDEEINKLKAVLRSLVVSSPTQVDVRTLMKDYRNMIGTQLPISKYGYKDPVTFLKERCTDCFLLNGTSTNPTLTLIVTDSIKHIDKFVQKQKSTPMVKMKGKRTSIAETKVNPPETNLIAKSFIKRKLEQKPKVTNDKNNVNGNIRTVNQPTDNIVPNTLHVQTTTKFDDNSYNIQENDTCTQTALQNFLKKRTALHSCSQSQSTSDGSSEKDEHSGRLTSSTSSSTKRKQLEELNKKIIDIINEHPDGVWCTDLLRLYRARFNRELDFIRFGFTSVLSLACALEHVRASRRAGGDWLLSDARRAAPARAPPARAPPAPPRAPRAPVDPDDALPGDWECEADTYPEDCLHFLESIPPPSLEGIQGGDMVEVAVAEVYSPSHFWMLRLGPEYNLALDAIMDEMNQYYRWGAGRERALAPAAVRAGQYCACAYRGDWHRALIVQVVDSDTVKVRYVDYGTVERAAAGALRPLRRAWAALPAQALRARLAAARPAGAAARWPRAAAAAFLRLVRDARLVANVVARHGAALEVLLVDTSGARDRVLGAELVRAGHAAARAAPHAAPHAPTRAEWYLHPSFEALEAGDTLSFAELNALHRLHLAPDCVDAYRLHVPPVPSPTPSPSPSSSPSPSPSPSSSSTPSSSLSPTPSPPPRTTILEANSSPQRLQYSPRASCIAFSGVLPLPQPPVEHRFTPRFSPPPRRSQTPEADSSPPRYSPHAANQHPTSFNPVPLSPTLVTGPYARVEYRFTPRCSPPPRPPPPPPPPVYVPHPVPHFGYMPPPFYVPNGIELTPMYMPQVYTTERSQTPGVCLSTADCEAFTALSRVNPLAAQNFMLEAISRGIRVPKNHGNHIFNSTTQLNVSAIKLNPNAAEFTLTRSETPMDNILVKPPTFPPPGFENFK